MRRAILLPLLITIAVVGVASGLGIWVFSNYTFYSTNDAIVESKVTSIDAPQVASVTSISVKKDDPVTAGQEVAQIQMQGGGAGQALMLKTPVSGTVLMTASQGSLVTAGYPIVLVTQTADASVGEASIVAFVEEGIVERLRLGQEADVRVDAYQGTLYRGRVSQILRQTAAQFQETPTADYASGNFTKVTQRVPVLIALDPGLVSNQLLQGLSAEVTIHLL